jgi:hypothetical protein
MIVTNTAFEQPNSHSRDGISGCSIFPKSEECTAWKSQGEGENTRDIQPLRKMRGPTFRNTDARVDVDERSRSAPIEESMSRTFHTSQRYKRRSGEAPSHPMYPLQFSTFRVIARPQLPSRVLNMILRRTARVPRSSAFRDVSFGQKENVCGECGKEEQCRDFEGFILPHRKSLSSTHDLNIHQSYRPPSQQTTLENCQNAQSCVYGMLFLEKVELHYGLLGHYACTSTQSPPCTWSCRWQHL